MESRFLVRKNIENQGLQGIQGPQGPQGPAGTTALNPNGFQTQNISRSINTTSSSATIVATISITTTQISSLWATASLQFEQHTAQNKDVYVYLTIASTTSDTTIGAIVGKNTSTPSYASISINHKTNVQVPAGTYTVNVYAYAPAGGVSCTHSDVFVIGNIM